MIQGVIAAACCCEDGWCDGLPPTIVVSWSGALEIESEDCCDEYGDPFCTPEGRWRMPTSVAGECEWIVEDAFAEVCYYSPEHIDEIEEVWAQVPCGENSDCSESPAQSVRGEVTVSPPYRAGDGYWHVTVACRWLLSEFFWYCNQVGQISDVCTVPTATLDFIGPAWADGPVGTYATDVTSFMDDWNEPDCVPDAYWTVIADNPGTVTVSLP